MAGNMICDACGEHPAAFIIGNTLNGEQLAVCPADAGRWGLTMALSQLEPDELADRLEQAAQEAGAAAQEPQEPQERPKRRRKASEQAAGPEIAAQGLEEAQAAAQD